MKYLVKNSRETSVALREKTLTLDFFFHAQGSDLQKTSVGLYRSLLFQMLDAVPGCAPGLIEAFKKRSLYCKSYEWRENELLEFVDLTVQRIAGEYDLQVFIDALDEVGEKVACRLVQRFHRLQQFLWSSGEYCCRICFSCRDYPIVDLFGDLKIRVEDENTEDIETYINTRLNVFGLDESKIAETIFARANGVFQWVLIVIEQVIKLKKQRALSDSEIAGRIEGVPEELSDLYRDLLCGIDEKDKPESLKLFQWICFANGYVTLQMTADILAFNYERPCRSLTELRGTATAIHLANTSSLRDRIKALSCGLLTFRTFLKRPGADGDQDDDDNPLSYVEFIHQSAVDFLLESGGFNMLNSFNTAAEISGHAHYRISRQCIACFGIASAGEVEKAREPLNVRSVFMRRDELLEYTLRFGMLHAKIAEASGISRFSTRDLLQYLAWQKISLDKFDELIRLSLCDPPFERGNIRWTNATFLHLAAAYGLNGMLYAILYESDQTHIIPLYRTIKTDSPLYFAAHQGQLEAAKQLWHAEGSLADLDLHCSSHGVNPLMAAAANGHLEVVDFLVKQGVDASSTDSRGRSAFIYASKSRQDNIATILFNSTYACVNNTNNEYALAFRHATRYDLENLAKAMVSNAAVEINKADKEERTSLNRAAYWGAWRVFKLLSTHPKADVNTQDLDGRTPLSNLFSMPHSPMDVKDAVRHLLDNEGVDVDVGDREGRTPLFYASQRGQWESKGMILPRCMDQRPRDRRGMTPLLAAFTAPWGSISLTEHLAQPDVDVNDKDDYGRSALFYAADGDDIEELCQHGAEVNIQDHEFRTPLSLAAEDGRMQSVEELLKIRGSDVFRGDNQGYAPTEWARIGLERQHPNETSRNKYIHIIEMLKSQELIELTKLPACDPGSDSSVSS